MSSSHDGTSAWPRLAVALFITCVVAAALVGWRIIGLSADDTHVTATARPIRLHVVPNSNSVDDQTLKLQLRDGLLPLVHALTDEVDPGEAGEVLVRHSDFLLAAARQQLRDAGVEYDVRIATENDASGQLVALRIVIGEGAGNNWFCVLVPPLCFSDLDAVERRPVEDEQAEGGVQFAWRWLGELFSKLSLPVESVGHVDQDDVDTDLAHTPPRDGDVGAAAKQ